MKRAPLYFIFITTAFFSLSVQAAKIAKVNGKKAYLILDSRVEAVKGDIYEVIDPQGAKKGLIKVMKVKGGRALGLLKGSAKKGWNLKKRSSSQAKKGRSGAPQKDRYESLKQASASGSFYGILAGFSSNSMSAKIEQGNNTTLDVDMTGSGFSGRLLFDYALWTSLWFRGLLGLENFATKGDANCGLSNNEECKVEISYLALDLWGRYLLTQGTFRPWIGLGFNLLFPSSQVSTAIDEESITSTSVFAAGGGVDWFFKPDMYMPIQIEYGMFPSSETVSVSYISFRLGVAIDF